MSSGNNNTNGTLKSCGACSQDMARSAFSKKQWERKKFRRCKACVENENPFQRPSKKNYQPENNKTENPLMVIPPAKELTQQEKPQVTPERTPFDPVVLDDIHVDTSKELFVSNLETKPAEIPVNNHAETYLQEGAKQISAATTMAAATVKESLNDIAGQPSSIKAHESFDRDILSETTKSNSGKISVEVPLVEPPSSSMPSAAVAGDENTVQKSTMLVATKLEKDADSTPPTTPKDQQPSDPIRNTSSLSSWPLSSRITDPTPPPSFELETPSKVEAMVQEHDAIFRSVISPQPHQGHQESSEQYDNDDLLALHRVSTDDVMDIEVEPIVNVEQEIYDLLNNPSSSEQGILFVDNSEELFKDQDDEDSPSSNIFSKRPSTAEASTPAPSNAITAMNNEGQASDANVEETTADPSSTTVSPPIETAITTRERIESDAQDWDPSAMASLSPTPSMPSSPPPVPPMVAAEDAEDDVNEEGNHQVVSFRKLLAQYASALGYVCGGCMFGVIISALLLPQDHAVLLVFAGLSLILAILMLVADLSGDRGDGASQNLDVNALVGFTCFISVLGLILSTILLPYDHALLLVFAVIAVGSAGIMLVSQLYYNADRLESSRSGGDDGRLVVGDGMAVDDSLREPLLSGAEDRVLISDEV